ncbi:hypothetical protein B0G77_5998 [Paraburkholderia sp. BL10I2N1]|nr:hypothetical protein B0G77_5998 [Paraburkholderia sp. BL10I2N1]
MQNVKVFLAFSDRADAAVSVAEGPEDPELVDAFVACGVKSRPTSSVKRRSIWSTY